MVKFKLIKIEGGFYYYEIYPEGNLECKGYLTFNPETKEIKDRIIPTEPYDGEKYLNHAISGFKDENGNYKDSGMVAWG